MTNLLFIDFIDQMVYRYNNTCICMKRKRLCIYQNIYISLFYISLMQVHSVEVDLCYSLMQLTKIRYYISLCVGPSVLPKGHIYLLF